MLIGYARASTFDQNIDIQEDALKKAGCERIFSDKISGSRKDRPGLNEAMSHLMKGDTLVLWKLDRLGRSLRNLIDITSKLDEMGVHFQSITDGIDTKTPEGQFFFRFMAALAQMERDLMIERTKAGLAAARERGRKGGRKRAMTATKLESAKKLLAEGIPPKDVAQNLGVSIPTLYRWCPATSVENGL